LPSHPPLKVAVAKPPLFYTGFLKFIRFVHFRIKFLIYLLFFQHPANTDFNK